MTDSLKELFSLLSITLGVTIAIAVVAGIALGYGTGNYILGLSLFLSLVAIATPFIFCTVIIIAVIETNKPKE